MDDKLVYFVQTDHPPTQTGFALKSDSDLSGCLVVDSSMVELYGIKPLFSLENGDSIVDHNQVALEDAKYVIYSSPTTQKPSLLTLQRNVVKPLAYLMIVLALVALTTR